MTDLRLRFVMILALLGVIVAVWTFPLWYPSLNRQTIAERFPGLELAAQPAFASLPFGIQQAYLELRENEDVHPELALALVRSRLLETDQQAPEANEPFEPPSATIARSGDFRVIDPLRGAQGSVTIYQLTDLTRVMRFSESFRSTRAPDVHVIFTRNPDPTDERGVGVDYIDLGALRGNAGAQTYSVPTGFEFSQYPILALYSVQYDYVISTVTLR